MQITWRISEHYERLVTVAAEVLATRGRKVLSWMSVLDSSSSRACSGVPSVSYVNFLFVFLKFRFIIRLVYLSDLRLGGQMRVE